MKRLFTILFASMLFAMAPVYAMDLNQAKSSGLVGETPSGYLQAVTGPTPEVKALIKNINDKRKAQYKNIAEANGTSMETVEQMAGKKAIDKTAKGHFVKINGQWRKK